MTLIRLTLKSTDTGATSKKIKTKTKTRKNFAREKLLRDTQWGQSMFEVAYILIFRIAK